MYRRSAFALFSADFKDSMSDGRVESFQGGEEVSSTVSFWRWWKVLEWDMRAANSSGEVERFTS